MIYRNLQVVYRKLQVVYRNLLMVYKSLLIVYYRNLVISCLREFLLVSQVYSQLIYLIKFIFTNRTSVHVKPGLISSKQTWFDVNGQGEQKEIHANMILQRKMIKRGDWLLNVPLDSAHLVKFY